MTDINTIGVIGAGQMGGGIAQVFAAVGYDIFLHDVEEERISAGLDAIKANLGRQVAKEKMTPEKADAAMARFHKTPAFEGLKDCDIVIEAATENVEVKKDIFRRLSAILKPDGIIATNTSSISITALAAVTDRPERFIGLHFMNPVPVMKLVELIRGLPTSDETYARTQALAESMGKTVVTSQDSPGFIVNRILIPLINEACFALQENTILQIFEYSVIQL